MGFQVPKRTYRLRFDDGSDLDGAEIVTREPSIEEYLRFAEQWDDRDSADDMVATLDLFTRWVVEWNLEDDGEPLPISAASMLTLPPRVAVRVVSEWLRAVVAGDAPFDAASTRGDDQTVVSLPMEPLSPSRAS